MTLFEMLAAIEDKKFIDQTNETIEWYNTLHEPHCWRDGKGVMHALRPVVGVDMATGKQSIVGRKPRCGCRYSSTVEHDPESVITCITCLTQEY